MYDVPNPENVYNMYTTCIHIVYSMYIYCINYVYILYTVCIHYVNDKKPTVCTSSIGSELNHNEVHFRFRGAK